MIERPILFSAPMVRAILTGTKTQTRHVVSPQPAEVSPAAGLRPGLIRVRAPDACLSTHEAACPYGAPGDRLWVRETWAPADMRHSIVPVVYRADGDSQPCADDRWRPSIHMPRWASRLTLEVTSVRVERLTAISEEDARAEGVTPCSRCHGTGIDPVRVGHDPDWCSECGGSAQGTTHRDEFERLWDAINGKRPGCAWADDPWVWAIDFKRVEAS